MSSEQIKLSSSKEQKRQKEQAEMMEIVQIVESKTGLKFKPESIKLLAGGVVSIVFAAETIDGQKLVIKHTKTNPELGNNFTSAEKEGLLSTAAETHDPDAYIGQRLGENGFCVPTIIRHLAGDRITVMRDFRPDGFELAQDILVNGQIIVEMGAKTGKTLADLRIFSEQNPNLPFVEEELEIQKKERFEEARIKAYKRRTPAFNALQQRFIAQKDGKKYPYLSWTDAHLKNMGYNKETGELIIFDFGRMIPCDPEHVLPAHLAHLILSAISGLLDTDLAIQYTMNCINSYIQTYKKYNPDYQFDEKVFLQYLMAEMRHRAGGRWVDKAIVDNNSIVFRKFFLNFEEAFEKIETIEEMYNMLKLRDILYSKENAARIISLASQVAFALELRSDKEVFDK